MKPRWGNVAIVVAMVVVPQHDGVWAILLASTNLNTYVDPAHRFSFKVPSNERVQDVPTASGVYETLIIYGGAYDAQIVITPWTGDASLADLEIEYP